MHIRRTLMIGFGLAATLLAACGGGGDSTTPSPSLPAATATSEAPGGDVYVFGKANLTIVDAATGSVVKTITAGLEGISSWDDTARSPDGKRLYISAHTKNEVLVFDTTQRSLLKSIPVGTNPVHLSLLNNGKELWSHSDAEGAFYVIDTATLQVVDKVEASNTHTGHGALVDPPGSSVYYATNVNTPALFVIDAASRKVTKTIPVCQGSDGAGGAHGIGYSSQTRYVYVQCSGALPHIAVVDTKDGSVAKYLDTTGDIYSAPDYSLAAVANSKTNTLDLLDTAPGPARFTSVPIPNRAASAFFASVDGKTLAFVADLKSPDVEVVDVGAARVMKTIPGAPLAAQGPDTIVPRSSDLGGGFFYTVVRPAGALNIIDIHSLAVVHTLTVDGGFTVAYVGHPAAP